MMEKIHSEFLRYFSMVAGEEHSKYSNAAYHSFVIAWIILFAFILHFVLHRYLAGFLSRILRLEGGRRLRASTALIIKRIFFVLQGAVVKIQAHLWLDGGTYVQRVIDTTSDIWILLFVLLTIYALLDHLKIWMLSRERATQFPIRGLLQSIKLIISIIFGLIAISILLNKSPAILLSGLGALSAVFMLVFKDPILGLVAGIQLSANNMLTVGDWLEMPKYGADGDVIDIGLTTVKVQNWDKTITTIPTYALISDSFKNWRGMSQSGGRRIKRSVFIDVDSIRFLTDSDIVRLSSISLLRSYLEHKAAEVNADNSKLIGDSLDRRRLTNVGTFRAYLVEYLRHHPNINQNMTLIVRQLDPSSNGLPIQIYTFTNTTNWVSYENIQSDIFDHIFSIMGEFDLRFHSSPTGHDIVAALGSNMSRQIEQL